MVLFVVLRFCSIEATATAALLQMPPLKYTEQKKHIKNNKKKYRRLKEEKKD